jgi:copper(I)-binding protein
MMKSSDPMRLLASIVVIACAITLRTDCTANPLVAMKTLQDRAVTAESAVRVDSAWVRAAPPGAMMQSGYMVLRNDGRTPARFVSAQSDAFGMVELHRSLLVNGVSTMRPAGAQTIPAGGTLQIEPGGLHLMLMQPQRDLKIGDRVHFRLHFDDGGVVDAVAKVSAQPPPATTH